MSAFLMHIFRWRCPRTTLLPTSAAHAAGWARDDRSSPAHEARSAADRRPECRPSVSRLDRRRGKPIAGVLWGLGLLLVCLCVSARSAATDDRTSAESQEELAAIEARVARRAEFLASDELEGRAAGSKGLEMAAQFIAEEFRQIGLDTTACGGTPFQSFTATIGTRLGPDNRLVFRGSAGRRQSDRAQPQEIEPAVGKDYLPLAVSGSGEFDLPLVFVGYGITAEKLGYDDYADVDVNGKAVIILRHEPRQDDPQSPFNGTSDSPFAPISRKLANAVEHKAAAVILCTDQVKIEQELAEARKAWLEAVDRLDKACEELKRLENPTAEQLDQQRRRLDGLLAEVQRASQRVDEARDPLLPFHHAGRASRGRDIPVFHCRRQLLDRVLLSALGKDLATLEAQIDEHLKPQSCELRGWQIAGEVDLERVEVEMHNVVGILEGSGPRSRETIVIGAHYDHVGRSSSGRTALPDAEGPICNGADDNASGVAVMLEVAQLLARREEKLPRRVVFVAFAGEESGLLGSNYYVEHPVVPLKQTIAMLNLDMVGRMREQKLMVLGSQSGRQFGDLLKRVNRRHGLNLSTVASRAGASDQVAFYAHKIPVMHFFTGLHADYHRPSDDFEKLNLEGMARVARLVADVAEAVARMPQPPEFAQLSSGKRGGRSSERAYLGTVPDFGAQDGKGYAIAGVTPGGPADRAGLRAGDIVVRFGESLIGSLDDMQTALTRHKSGQRVPVVVVREGKRLRLEVTLGRRP